MKYFNCHEIMNESGFKKVLLMMLLILWTAHVYADSSIEWTCVNGNLPNDIQINVLAVDPSDSSVIYAAGQDGVYKSTNGGDAWIPINNGLKLPNNKPLTDKKQGYGRNINVALTIDQTDSNIIYLSYIGRIFKSIDKGEMWIDITNNLDISTWEQLSIAAGQENIYVGNNNGVYKSTNGGNTWTKMNSTPMSADIYCSVSLDNAGKLYAATYQGIFVSADEGATWTKVSSEEFRSLIVCGTVSYAAKHSGFYKSTDNGATWSPKNTGLPNSINSFCIGVDPTNTNIVYASINYYYAERHNNALYKTVDGGDNWTEITTLSPAAQPANILIAANGKIYAAGKGIYRSTDNSSTWSIINNGLPHHVNVYAITADSQNDGTVYLLNRHGIFKSTDCGNTWEEKNNGVEIKYPIYAYKLQFHTLVIDPNNSNILYVGGNQTLYKSTDGGNSWGSITTGLPQYFNVTGIVVTPNDSDIVYIYNWI
ncbi:MAG: hypothetical protein QME49_06260, partial [bacterium]|nr:hypothetical protein [bacterium]